MVTTIQLSETIKMQLGNMKKGRETYEDVIVRHPYYIEVVHNLKRLYSVLGYLAPNDFEEIVIIQQCKGISNQTILILSV